MACLRVNRNGLFDSDTGEFNLVDFGRSSKLNKDTKAIDYNGVTRALDNIKTFTQKEDPFREFKFGNP